ncbi:MAG: MFS transporter, partial [Candidatus Dormibacteria bacterium]
MIEPPASSGGDTDRRSQRSGRGLIGGPADDAGLRSGYGVRPLLLLILLSAFIAFDGEGFNILQPLIKHDLGLNFLKFFSLTSAAATASLLLAGPLGYLCDRVRRTALIGVGGVLSGAGMLLTGLAGAPLALGAARALSRGAWQLAAVPQLSLLADYYAVDKRVRVVTLVQVGGLAATVLSLPLVTVLAHLFGWRVAFYALWAPVVLAALYVMLRLPEPVRGYQERHALGVADQEAHREQPVPSWAEAWRLLWSSRVVRYTCYTWAVLSAGYGFLNLRTFYFFQVWHQTPGDLAAIRVVSTVVDLLALLVGGGLVNRVAATRPHRVFQLTAAFYLLTAANGVVFVLAPVFWLSVVSSVIVGALGTLATVSSLGLILNVMPPRARGTAIATFAYWGIPGLFLAIGVGGLADAIGLQATILAGTILPVVAALLSLATARFYESDVRNAELSAAAAEAHRASRLEGEPKLLIARQLDVRYGAVQTLFGVDLDVDEGEIIAILGTNGAGKSTLLRALAGVHEATSGAVVFAGDDVTHLPPNEMAARGILYVQGGRSLFPSLSVRDNLFLGGRLARDGEDRRALLERAFQHFPVLRERANQTAGTLSTGEQQMLALSNALLTRPRLLLVDELSLGLAPALVSRLVGILRTINAEGTTVILVEQSIAVALQVARRAVFLERGIVRFTGPATELAMRRDLLRAVFLTGGTSIEQGSAPRLTTAPATPPGRGAPAPPSRHLLEVAHVDQSYGGRRALRDVSLTLAPGAVLGLIGPNGAGKTTLLDVISGFVRQDAGAVFCDGTDVTLWGADARARYGMVRHFRGARLFPTLTVEEVLTIFIEQSEAATDATTPSTGRQPLRRTRSTKESLDGLVALAHLERYRESPVADLSTGLRRLVDLAGAMAGRPRLLLLDEPAAGLAHAEIEALPPILHELRARLG